MNELTYVYNCEMNRINVKKLDVIDRKTSESGGEQSGSAEEGTVLGYGSAPGAVVHDDGGASGRQSEESRSSISKRSRNKKIQRIQHMSAMVGSVSQSRENPVHRPMRGLNAVINAGIGLHGASGSGGPSNVNDADEMESQQYCLRWNNHRSNLLTVFEQLLQTEAFTDVTLAVNGTSIKCHKMVLAACSSYFQSLFLENACPHPIVVFKDIQYAEIRAILEYMYRGEVNVAQEQLPSLLKVAEALRVKGTTFEFI